MGEEKINSNTNWLVFNFLEIIRVYHKSRKKKRIAVHKIHSHITHTAFGSIGSYKCESQDKVFLSMENNTRTQTSEQMIFFHLFSTIIVFFAFFAFIILSYSIKIHVLRYNNE